MKCHKQRIAALSERLNALYHQLRRHVWCDGCERWVDHYAEPWESCGYLITYDKCQRCVDNNNDRALEAWGMGW